MRGVMMCALGACICSGARSQGYNWVEAASPEIEKDLRFTLGTHYFNDASFGFSGLEGDLYGAAWIEARHAPADNVELFFSCTIRKYLSVDRILGADGSAFLDQPVAPGQTRQATGDFSLFTKWRVYGAKDSFALALLTGFTQPNTNLSSGMGLDIGSLHGRMLLDATFRRFSFSGNIGASLSNNPTVRGQDDFFTFGLGAAVDASRRLLFAGEVYGMYAGNDGPGDGLIDSLNLALGAVIHTNPIDITLTSISYLEDFGPASGFRLRLSREFAIGRK
ncbi:MAG: hypothetical protein ACE5GA_07165 [Candidatus Zixiibacteriota bacterium]